MLRDSHWSYVSTSNLFCIFQGTFSGRSPCKKQIGSILFVFRSIVRSMNWWIGWLTDFAHFREKLPYGYNSRLNAKKWLHHNRIKQYKGGEVRRNTIWRETVASSVCYKILSGRYDCTYGLPLFHAKSCFISPLFLCTVFFLMKIENLIWFKTRINRFRGCYQTLKVR